MDKRVFGGNLSVPDLDSQREITTEIMPNLSATRLRTSSRNCPLGAVGVWRAMSLVLAVYSSRGDAESLHASPFQNAGWAMRTPELDLLPHGLLRLRGGARAFEIAEDRLDMLTEDPPEGEFLTERQLRRSLTISL